MSYTPMDMPSIATRMATIITVLRAAIGTHVGRLTRPRHSAWIGDRFFIEAPRPQPRPAIPLPAWTVLWRRLQRLSDRFAALHARWQANTLLARRPRPARRAPAKPKPQPAPRLTRAFGWVNRHIPESAPPSGMLDALLRDPETQNFAAAAPQAGRLLRPLCRALGLVPPAWLRLPPRPRKPRPEKTTTRPERRPRGLPWPLLPTDKPLQGYVLGATRAWTKKTA
jgi:hypothetical protein